MQRHSSTECFDLEEEGGRRAKREGSRVERAKTKEGELLRRFWSASSIESKAARVRRLTTVGAGETLPGRDLRSSATLIRRRGRQRRAKVELQSAPLPGRKPFLHSIIIVSGQLSSRRHFAGRADSTNLVDGERRRFGGDHRANCVLLSLSEACEVARD